MAIADFKDRLLECLGGDWPEPGPLNISGAKRRRPKGSRSAGSRSKPSRGTRSRRCCLIPTESRRTKPARGIAVWHQHNGEWHLGKSEPAGLAGNPMHHTGAALAKRGLRRALPRRPVLRRAAGSDRQAEGGATSSGSSSCGTSSPASAWPGRTFSTCGGRSTYLVSRPEVQADSSAATATRWVRRTPGWSARGSRG